MPHLQQGTKVLDKKALQRVSKLFKMLLMKTMLTQRLQSVVEKVT